MIDPPRLPTRSVEDRLFGPGKKRILALDGGGTRGIITIAFMAAIERRLREETGQNDLVLAEVFDLVAGTSVGSMLATMVALGYDAANIEARFRDLAPKIFTGRNTLLQMKRFNAVEVTNGVRSITKNERLGSEKLHTGLVVIAKKVSTGSVWALWNNPKMPYWHDGPQFDGNKHYKLENIIRASTAAPFLFTPAEITIHTDRNGNEEKGLFIDGGVSPHNNPSLQALLMASLPSYHLNWTIDPEHLLLISIGTGQHRTPVLNRGKVLPPAIRWAIRRLNKEWADDIEEAAFAAATLRGMVNDASLFAIKMLQSISRPRFAWQINTEVGDLQNEFLFPDLRDHSGKPGPLIRYQRYDLPLERTGLVPPLYDVEASKHELKSLHAIDAPEHVDRLFELASHVAARQVDVSDFKGFI
jgi:uncharacterized protein